MNFTLIIIVVTCVISYLCFNNAALFANLKHHPIVEKDRKDYFRWLSAGFVHGDMMHLIVNMYVFYSFGTAVENNFIFHFGMSMGSTYFLISYLLIIILANIPTYYKHRNHSYFASVGASGGVSGILFIFILLKPWSMLGIYFIIPIPAIIFGGLYLWYSSWAANKQNDNIDHDGHFYGALAGILIAVILRPQIISEFIAQLLNNYPW